MSTYNKYITFLPSGRSSDITIYDNVTSPAISENWITATLLESTAAYTTYRISCSVYSSLDNVRTGTVTFNSVSQTSITPTAVYIFNIAQLGSYTSIWRDVFYNNSGGDLTYSIYSNEIKKYTGICLAGTELNLSRISEKYMSEYTLEGTDWIEIPTFTCLLKDSSSTLMSVAYCPDWSYEKNGYVSSQILNDPITLKGNILMPFYFSVCDLDGTIYKYRENITDISVGNPSSSFAFKKITPSSDTTTLSYLKGDELFFTYDMSSYGKGSFIYRNRYGGIDTFLIEGNISIIDNFSRGNSQGITPYLSHSFSKRTDRTEISRKYKCSTGWLSDTESEKLVFHLLSSPLVYFQNFENPTETIPVLVTNTSSEIKKFKNGRTLVRYDIEFENSKKQQIIY